MKSLIVIVASLFAFSTFAAEPAKADAKAKPAAAKNAKDEKKPAKSDASKATKAKTAPAAVK